MAKNTHIIEVKTIGANKSKKQIDGIGGSITGMATKIAGATAAVYAVKKAMDVAFDLTRQAGKVAGLERGFDNLGKKLGFTSDSLGKLRKAVNGTVDDMALMEQANNAMMLGVVSSDEEMAQLFDTAQRLGQALGVDTKDAVNSLVTGMGRQSKLMLDNLGIMVNMEDAYETYAESLGKTTEELTDAEKKTAFNNATLAESQRLVSELGDETLDNSSKMAQMTAALSNASNSLGEALAPAVILAAEGITALANAMSKLFTWQDRLEKQYNTHFKILSESEVAMRDYRQEVEKFGEQQIIDGIREVGGVLDTVTDSEIKATLASQEFVDMLQQAKEEGLEQGEMLEILYEKWLQLKTGVETTEDAYHKYAGVQFAKIQADKKEEENKKKFIKMYPEEAKALGMLDEEKKSASKTTASQVINNHKAQTESGLVAKIMESVAFPFNLALAALAGKMVDKLYSGITAAQYGADFITDGPQMMMVGEGSGPERVQVTPLVDPNIDGPQGQGITLNISGNVLHESFVEDNIIPQIREGLRLGENMGI